MSNNIGWKQQSHVTCGSINIIYYLKCNMCSKREIFNGKTVIIPLNLELQHVYFYRGSFGPSVRNAHVAENM